MKLKKTFISIMAILSTVFVATGTAASAHSGDYWGGKYIGYNNAKITLMISKSAQNALLNSEVYRSATSWNGISRNARVSVSFEIGARTSFGDEVYVYGKDLGKSVLGMTLPYDSDGNFISASNADSNWAYSEITMNTNIAAYNACENPTLMAKKAFIHEVGHAFKLKHPTINLALSGHTYGSGYPYAIMNQGSPRVTVNRGFLIK